MRIKTQTKLILLFLVLLTLDFVIAGQCVYNYKIYFGNGVFTSKKDAAITLDRLEQKITPHIPASLKSRVTFDVMYSDNSLIDLLEVFKQKKMEAFWDFVHGHGNPDEYKKYQEVIRNIFRTSNLLAPTIVTQKLQYESDLSNNTKAITVAHSQGNLYFNNVMDVIQTDKTPLEDYISTVAVATPASHVFANKSYITLVRDLVIAFVTNALPGKYTNFNSMLNLDTLNHKFLPSYLKGSSTGPSIVEATIKELRNMDDRAEPWTDPSLEDTTCMQWFNAANIDTEDKEQCLIDCTTKPTDSMATFNCNLDCKKFCHCTIKDNKSNFLF